MAITKDKKKQLLKWYVTDLENAKNAVIVKQSAIPVTLANKIRIELSNAEGKMNIIKKRIFLRALKDAGLEEVSVDALEGPVFALYAQNDEYAPLKVINKYLKEFKKDNKKPALAFIGGWFEKKRQDSEYVNELANVPSKEELISKLCYLFNYPLQSFAVALSEIAKKDGEVVAEGKEEKVEETKEEVKEEPKAEEPKVEEAAPVETPAE